VTSSTTTRNVTPTKSAPLGSKAGPSSPRRPQRAASSTGQAKATAEANTEPSSRAAGPSSRPPSQAASRQPSTGNVPQTQATSSSSRAPTPHAADVDAVAMPPPTTSRVLSPTNDIPLPQRQTTLARTISASFTPTIPPPSEASVSKPNLPSNIAAPVEQESAGVAFAQKREVEELRIKVRLLEGRRSEDQERIKALESKVGEADALRAARVKLQGE
jgi:dynactin 1